MPRRQDGTSSRKRLKDYEKIILFTQLAAIYLSDQSLLTLILVRCRPWQIRDDAILFFFLRKEIVDIGILLQLHTDRYDQKCCGLRQGWKDSLSSTTYLYPLPEATVLPLASQHAHCALYFRMSNESTNLFNL